MQRRQPNISNRQRGFTIVELLITIVVIGILAAIIILTYSGMQKRALTSDLQGSLNSATKAMEIARAESGIFPTALPVNLKTSPNITLTLKGSGQSVYSSLTAPQNGLLLFTTCQTLLSEGVGAKPDDNNDYISSCEVFNKNQIQINGWNGRTVSTPLTIPSLATYVDSYVGGSAAEFKTHGQAFMDQLSTRFTASGGQFPVTSFWDSWATPQNGGVMMPTLPTPTISSSDPNTFCIEGTSTAITDLVWHIKAGGTPSSGACT